MWRHAEISYSKKEGCSEVVKIKKKNDPVLKQTLSRFDLNLPSEVRVKH